jgi:hypothetical protein
MSALGQKQGVQRTSQCLLSANSGHSAIYSMISSARARSERRDGQTKCFSGGQIDCEIELGRLFDGEITGLGSAQNLPQNERRAGTGPDSLVHKT